MSARSEQSIIENGIFYTPPAVAALLAGHVAIPRCARVLDPACGEGSLLAAIEQAWHRRTGSVSGTPLLCGCDKFLPRKYGKGASGREFHKGDFLSLAFSHRFDIVVTNPPFLASERLSPQYRNQCHEAYGAPVGLPAKSDIWAYFLLKSISHVELGGSVAAVLPWAFLQADYARPLRSWLLDRFRKIEVLVLTNGFFHSTSKRVLLLWLADHGAQTETITAAFSGKLVMEASPSSLSRAQWIDEPFACAQGADIPALLAECRMAGLRTLSEVAKIKIGIVTGANAHFVVSPQDASERGFHHAHLRPILTSSSDLNSLVMNGETPEQFLLALPPAPPARYDDYLEQMVKEGIHLRSHSVRRRPWFSVNTGDTPDAFVPYRVSRCPFLSFNAASWQCTNAIHRVYFNGSTPEERQWVQISMLALPAQVAIEASSPVYGNGMLKIEPNSLEHAPIFVSGEPLPREEYARIQRLFGAGRRDEAVAAATALLQAKAGLAPRLVAQLQAAHGTLRAHRLGV